MACTFASIKESPHTESRVRSTHIHPRNVPHWDLKKLAALSITQFSTHIRYASLIPCSLNIDFILLKEDYRHNVDGVFAVRSCRSSPVLEMDDTVAIVLGTLAAVVGAGLLGAFIYYLRMR